MNELIEKYKAEEILEKILVEKDDSKLTTKIHGTIHKFYERIRSLNCVNKEQRTYFLQLLFNETKNNIRLNKYDKEIETFLLNTLTAIYRYELIPKIERRI